MSIVIAMKGTERTNVLDERFIFKVPNNTTSIAIKITKEIDHYLTMGVFDSKGRLRGQFLYGGKDSLIIHSQKSKSTPYTVSGDIPAGNWYCSILGEGDYHDAEEIWGYIDIRFDQEVDTEFTDDIWVDTETYPYLSGFEQGKVYKTEKTWYKGDLHTHTTYSDGEMSREELENSAISQGLDFIVNTDHNVMTTGWPKPSNLLVIPGIEYSFYHGHANILNPNRLPYQSGDVNLIATQEGVLKAFDEDYGPHSLWTINHPVLGQHTWQYGRLPLDKIDSIEVINSPNYYFNDTANEWSLLAWDFLLSSGHRIAGVGGSDIHRAPESKGNAMVGDPATYIYSKVLSAIELIAGIKSRNVVVSRIGFIDKTFKEYLPGDNISENKGTISCELDTQEEVYIEWVVDGEVVQTDLASVSSYTFAFNGNYHWIRVNIRYKNGLLAGITNPYFYGEKAPEIESWQSVIDYLNEIIPETAAFYHEK